MRNEKFMSGIARFLVVFMMTASVIAPAQAAMMGTESLAAPATSTDARAALADKLISLGVERSDAESRVALLSNDQASEVLAKADELPAGAGALEVIALIFLILVITDLIGVTDVFPFIKKAGN
jgi:hypothetical protein